MTETVRPRGTPTITPDCQNGVGVPFTPRFPRSLRPESLWTPCSLRPESLCVLRVLCGQNPSVFSMFSAVDSLRVLGVLPADHPSPKYDLLDQPDLLLPLAPDPASLEPPAAHVADPPAAGRAAARHPILHERDGGVASTGDDVEDLAVLL